MEVPSIPISERMRQSLIASNPREHNTDRKRPFFFVVKQKDALRKSKFLEGSFWARPKPSEVPSEGQSVPPKRNSLLGVNSTQIDSRRGGGSQRESRLSLPRVTRGSLSHSRSPPQEPASFRSVPRPGPPPIPNPVTQTIYLDDFLRKNLINYPQNTSRVFYFVRRDSPYSFQFEPHFNAFDYLRQLKSGAATEPFVMLSATSCIKTSKKRQKRLRISRFLKDAENFTKISEIPLIKNFLAIKIFKSWLFRVRRHRFQSVRKDFERKCFGGKLAGLETEIIKNAGSVLNFFQSIKEQVRFALDTPGRLHLAELEGTLGRALSATFEEVTNLYYPNFSQLVGPFLYQVNSKATKSMITHKKMTTAAQELAKVVEARQVILKTGIKFTNMKLFVSKRPADKSLNKSTRNKIVEREVFTVDTRGKSWEVLFSVLKISGLLFGNFLWFLAEQMIEKVAEALLTWSDPGVISVGYFELVVSVQCNGSCLTLFPSPKDILSAFHRLLANSWNSLISKFIMFDEKMQQSLGKIVPPSNLQLLLEWSAGPRIGETEIEELFHKKFYRLRKESPGAFLEKLAAPIQSLIQGLEEQVMFIERRLAQVQGAHNIRLGKDALKMMFELCVKKDELRQRLVESKQGVFVVTFEQIEERMKESLGQLCINFFRLGFEAISAHLTQIHDFNQYFHRYIDRNFNDFEHFFEFFKEFRERAVEFGALKREVDDFRQFAQGLLSKASNECEARKLEVNLRALETQLKEAEGAFFTLKRHVRVWHFGFSKNFEAFFRSNQTVLAGLEEEFDAILAYCTDAAVQETGALLESLCGLKQKTSEIFDLERDVRDWMSAANIPLLEANPRYPVRSCSQEAPIKPSWISFLEQLVNFLEGLVAVKNSWTELTLQECDFDQIKGELDQLRLRIKTLGLVDPYIQPRKICIRAISKFQFGLFFAQLSTRFPFAPETVSDPKAAQVAAVMGSFMETLPDSRSLTLIDFQSRFFKARLQFLQTLFLSDASSPKLIAKALDSLRSSLLPSAQP